MKLLITGMLLLTASLVSAHETEPHVYHKKDSVPSSGPQGDKQPQTIPQSRSHGFKVPENESPRPTNFQSVTIPTDARD